MTGRLLIVEPETAIPDNLRNLIFAAEPECLAALRGFQQIQRSFEELVEIAQKADVYGARYALVPEARGDVTLAIFSLFDALPPDLWRALNARRGDIAATLATLGVKGSVSLDDILNLVRRYDRRAEAN